MGAVAKKWTKVDITRMQQTISSFYVCNRPLDTRGMDDFVSRFRAALEQHRTEIVVRGLEGNRSIAQHRAEENDKTAIHYREHFKSEEMFAHFDGLAREERKSIAKLDALIARVRSDGLPVEVVSFDPSVRQ